MPVKTKIRWVRVIVIVAIGTASWMAGTWLYYGWRLEQGDWCVRHYGDGTDEILFGADCGFPDRQG